MDINSRVSNTKDLINEYSKNIDDTDNKIYQLDKMINSYKETVKNFKNAGKLLIFGFPVVCMFIVSIANVSSFVMDGVFSYLPQSLESLLLFFLPSTALGTYVILKADKMTEEEFGISLKEIKLEKSKYLSKKDIDKEDKNELEEHIDDLLFMDECLNKYDYVEDEKDKTYVKK